VLQVADNGPGIATDAQAQLFEPFFRAAETVTVPGTGLGLATTKRLVDAHGGVIDIQSAIAQGTLVSIRIPLAVDLG
jgi:two-component system, OmpR family, sensor kinase